MRTYPTVLKNETRKPVEVWDGPILVAVLEPGRTFEVEGTEPDGVLSRYDRLTWTAKGVDASVRPGWREPDRGRWVTTLLNVDGEQVEERRFGGQLFRLMRGIPVLHAFEPNVDEVLFERIELREVEEEELSPAWPGYLIQTLRLRPILSERSEKGLDEIRAERERTEVQVKTPTVLPPQPPIPQNEVPWRVGEAGPPEVVDARTARELGLVTMK